MDTISIYVLIIIIKEKLSIQQDLYIILQILSVNIFNKILLKELFKKSNNLISADPSDKQLLLFNF